MKKTLLLLFTIISVNLSAQVVLKGVSPSVAGMSFDFTWADPTGGGWSTPDFNQPNTFVQDTLELVNDPTHTGDNPAYAIPHPLANEGCLTLNGDQYSQPSLAGKIAVVWRGSCQFGLKAALAENNGAVGIIIINHSGAPVGMAGGDSGMVLNIPVVMISTNDGQFLLNEMLNGPVEIFMGNKLGANVNDVGSSVDVANRGKFGSIPLDMANNGHTFDVGLSVTNFGSDDNTPILDQTVTGPGGQIYTSTLNLGLTAAYATVDTMYETVAHTGYVTGEYTIDYNLSIDSEVDADTADNHVSSTFNVTNDVLSLARTDETTGELVANYFPSNAITDYSSCMALMETYPTTSFGVEGIYFAMSEADSSVGSEYVEVQFFEWNDPFGSISAAGGFAGVTYNDLNPVKVHDFICADDSLNQKVLYTQFDEPVILVDGQRYLVCLQTFNPALGFGYDNGIDYGSNVAYYDQPVGALNIDLTNWYSGWSAADAPSIGLKMGDFTGIAEQNNIEGILYPNPTKTEFTLNFGNVKGSANIMIFDVSGRLAKSTSVNNIESSNRFDVTELNDGHYFVKVNLENGKTSNFNMVISK